MDNINKQIEELNKKFHPDGKFIPGGVLDETRFKNTNVRMLVILKEVNDPKSDYNWSLPGFFKDMYMGKRTFYRLWKNVSSWALVTENPNLNYQDIDEPMLKEGLKLFAIINLKKDAGSGSSDSNVILKETIKYQKEWLKEIDIINPKLILCGGTFDILVRSLDIKNISRSDSGFRYFINNNKLFLEFYHPACRKSYQFLYETFKNLFESIKPLIK